MIPFESTNVRTSLLVNLLVFTCTSTKSFVQKGSHAVIVNFVKNKPHLLASAKAVKLVIVPGLSIPAPHWIKEPSKKTEASLAPSLLKTVRVLLIFHWSIAQIVLAWLSNEMKSALTIGGLKSNTLIN